MNIGDIDYKAAWLALNALVKKQMQDNEAWDYNMIVHTMNKIQDESRVNFNLGNVYCPRCACPHVTPILYSCDAEHHIFGQGAWYQTQLIESQIEIIKLRKVITEKHKRFEAKVRYQKKKELKARLTDEADHIKKVKGRIKKIATRSLNAHVSHAKGGLSGTHRIMAYVGMNPDKTAKQIAKALKIPIKNVAPRLTKLFDAHQVSRSVENGRYTYHPWGEVDEEPKKRGRPKKR